MSSLFKIKKADSIIEFADAVLENIMGAANRIAESLVLELKNQCGINPEDINKNVLNIEIICMAIAVDSKSLPHLIKDAQKVKILNEYATCKYFYHLEDTELRDYIIEGIKKYSNLFDKAIGEDKYFDTFLYTQLVIQSLGNNAVKYGMNQIQHEYLSIMLQPLIMGYWKSALKYVRIKD